MTISRDSFRKLSILAAIHRIDRPNLDQLCEQTDIQVSSLRRHLAALREDFGVDIKYTREDVKVVGSTGYYSIEDWGVFSQDRVLEQWKIHGGGG